MTNLDELLPEIFDDLAERAPHDPDLAARARSRVRRGRLALGAGALTLVVAALAVAVLVLPAVRPTREPATSGQGSVNVVPACHSEVVRGVLPAWARAGFSDPRPVMPYVRSATGKVLAILFTDRLTSPPRRDVANKVLWVWQSYPGTVAEAHLVARLGGTGPAVTAGLPTPLGPSYVDLPSPGCWRLTLTWPGGTDTIDLVAVRP
jgi:hypothetical protein